MSILTAVTRAYNVAMQRKYDIVYWCIDLHGTVLESNYSSDSFNFINGEKTIPALQAISRLPETRIILWSGISKEDEASVRKLFADHAIRVDWVNENPEVENSGTGHYDKKFYFSILVDDKAGFNPNDWQMVADHALINSSILQEYMEEVK